MPHQLKDVNLLPTVKRPKESTPYLMILSMVIVLGLFIFLGVHYFMTKSKLETKEAEYEQLQEEVEILQAEVEAKQKDENDGAHLSKAINFTKGHYVPTSIFIEELFDLLPDDSYLSEYNYGNEEADIEVHVETLDQVAEYTSKLNHSPYIIDTKLNDVESFTLKNEADSDPYEEIPRYETHFTLQIDKMRLKEAEEDDE